MNGVKVRDAVIYPEDQIAFGRNRFVIEAPGMRPRTEQPPAPGGGASPNITQTMKAIQIADKPAVVSTGSAKAHTAARNKNDIWWLIAAAALIAAGLALLFWVPF